MYGLRKFISIFFLAVYLLSTTQMFELLKMPLLVEHYIEHKEENKNLSFLDFLEFHYLYGNPKDADYDKDMKLPFKTISCLGNSTSIFIPQTGTDINKITSFVDDYKGSSEYSFHYTRSFFSSIWQPPKIG